MSEQAEYRTVGEKVKIKEYLETKDYPPFYDIFNIREAY